MATLTRRNVNNGETKKRSNSLWEQEADNYWQEMEPAKRYKKITGYVGFVLVGFFALGGAAWTIQTVWNNPDLVSFSALKDRFLAMPAVNITMSDSVGVPTSTPASAPTSSAPPGAPTSKLSASDPAAIDLLRARCRVRGVQTRWHEETCRKLCIRDPQNNSCMNGCSYGSITVTKLTCDQLEISAIPTATKCPEGVSCASACKAYEYEAPVPATRVACERACTNIVTSSCSRILQIYRDLYKGTLQ